MTVTIRVIASTMIVLRNMRNYQQPGQEWAGMAKVIPPYLRIPNHPLAAKRRFLLACSSIGGGTAVLLQLIMQGFQAYAEDFRCPRLIVAGGLQGLENEHFLGFFHRGPHPQPHRIRVAGCGAQWSLAKPRRQMLGLNHSAITNDNRSLDGIAQFADVSWPRIVIE